MNRNQLYSDNDANYFRDGRRDVTDRLTSPTPDALAAAESVWDRNFRLRRRASTSRFVWGRPSIRMRPSSPVHQTLPVDGPLECCSAAVRVLAPEASIGPHASRAIHAANRFAAANTPSRLDRIPYAWSAR